MKKLAFYVVGALLLALMSARPADANPVVSSSASGGITLNNAGPAGSIAIRATNPGADPAVTVEGFELILGIVSTGGTPTSGGFTLTPVFPASSTPISFSNPFPPTGGTGTTVGGHFYFTRADLSGTGDTLAPGASRGLFDLQIQANPGTTGTFNLVLIPADAPCVSSYDTDIFAPGVLSFANAGAVIGTITAVPEASAFVFGGVVTSIGGVVAWRRKARVA
jgi:hypothetical protein